MSRRWHCTEALINMFRDLRNHSSTSLFAAGILALPIPLASLAQWRAFGTGAIDLPSLFLWISITLLALFMTTVWLQAAIFVATREYASGSDPGVGGALGMSLGRTPRLLGTILLILLLYLGAVMVASLPVLGVLLVFGFGGAGRGAGLAALVAAGFAALAIFLILSVIIFLRFAMAPMASVLERLSPTAALARSRELMRGRWPDFFVLVLLVIGVGIGVNLILGGPSLVVTLGNLREGLSGIGPARMFQPGGLTLTAALVVALSSYLVQIAGAVIQGGSYANYYLGLRADEALEARALQSAGGGGFGEAGPAGYHEGDAGQQHQSPWEGEGAGKLGEEDRGDQG